MVKPQLPGICGRLFGMCVVRMLEFVIGNPLLGLQSRCKTYSATKYEYNDFFKLADIDDSQPDGYIARLAFYAQGTRNAHVLLSRTATPDLAQEHLYEFSK